MPIVHAPIAVCSWSLQARSPAELVARVQATGARAVQLALTPVVEKPEVWSGVFDALRAAGIEVVSGMLETVGEDYSTLETIRVTGGVVPDATWPATRARAAEVARVAGAHGVTLVTFHAGFIPHEAGAERTKLLGRLRDIASLFAGVGARIAFETGQESADTLAHALDELGDRSIGVNFDPANMILYGMGDPIAAVRALAPRIAQVHVKDALPASVAGTWGSEVRVGTGSVDWAAFLSALGSVPAPIRLAVEREAGGDRVGDIRAALELLSVGGITPY
ncbi:MAG: 3-dehydroshikimate dehydratase [Planctomycetota bacterium]|jgi:sugar phosphate isomerase/epimerase